MASLATLQTYLTELEAALHKLRIGELPSAITSPDGRETRYHKVDIATLRAEISRVEDEIAVAQSKPNPRRPIRFSF